MASMTAAPPPSSATTVPLPTTTAAAAAAASSSSSSSSPSPSSRSTLPIHKEYPVNAWLEVTTLPNRDVIRGRVYCTDAVSDTVVLQSSLVHTTLACQLWFVQRHAVLHKRFLDHGDGEHHPTNNEHQHLDGSNRSSSSRSNRYNNSNNNNNNELEPSPSVLPLIPLSQKALDEKEKRALRLAEEAWKHINQKVSPEGQAIFDRLLKACNDVVWVDHEDEEAGNDGKTIGGGGSSIVVLSQVRVDPPYRHDNCHLLSTTTTSSSSSSSSSNHNSSRHSHSSGSSNNKSGGGGGGGGGGMDQTLAIECLNRVQRIVASYYETVAEKTVPTAAAT